MAITDCAVERNCKAWKCVHQNLLDERMYNRPEFELVNRNPHPSLYVHSSNKICTQSTSSMVSRIGEFMLCLIAWGAVVAFVVRVLDSGL